MNYETTINAVNGRREWIKETGGPAHCPACGTVWPDATATVCVTCAAHKAKREREDAAARAQARVLSAELVSIERKALAKGFRFIGTMVSGEKRVLRGKATRPYTMAAIHDLGYVTFHQATPKPAGNWDMIIRVINIEDGNS
jgi:hypothetical protein